MTFASPTARARWHCGCGKMLTRSPPPALVAESSLRNAFCDALRQFRWWRHRIENMLFQPKDAAVEVAAHVLSGVQVCEAMVLTRRDSLQAHGQRRQQLCVVDPFKATRVRKRR